MARQPRLISIRDAAQEFELKRRQVRYAITQSHLQPVSPPLGYDGRCHWYSRARLVRLLQRVYPQMARAS